MHPGYITQGRVNLPSVCSSVSNLNRKWGLDIPGQRCCLWDTYRWDAPGRPPCQRAMTRQPSRSLPAERCHTALQQPGHRSLSTEHGIHGQHIPLQQARRSLAMPDWDKVEAVIMDIEIVRAFGLTRVRGFKLLMSIHFQKRLALAFLVNCAAIVKTSDENAPIHRYTRCSEGTKTYHRTHF